MWQTPENYCYSLQSLFAQRKIAQCVPEWLQCLEEEALSTGQYGATGHVLSRCFSAQTPDPGRRNKNQNTNLFGQEQLVQSSELAGPVETGRAMWRFEEDQEGRGKAVGSACGGRLSDGFSNCL